MRSAWERLSTLARSGARGCADVAAPPIAAGTPVDRGYTPLDGVRAQVRKSLTPVALGAASGLRAAAVKATAPVDPRATTAGQRQQSKTNQEEQRPSHQNPHYYRGGERHRSLRDVMAVSEPHDAVKLEPAGDATEVDRQGRSPRN